MSPGNLARTMALVLGLVPGLAAQPRLTLEDAIALAERNNPGFAAVRNDRGPADWEVRASYASLLPSVIATARGTYQEPGAQRIGSLDFGAANTDYLISSYGLSVTWSLDAPSLFQVGAARAAREATSATLRSAAFDLQSAVTVQYVAVLRARDAVEVARRDLERAEQNLALATVRAESGAVAGLDVKQATVERGRAEIAGLRADRSYRAERLALAERLGTSLDEDTELTTAAEPFEPTWAVAELLDRALEAHPALRAARARERVGRAHLREAKTGYLPTVSVSTGVSGQATEVLNKDYLVAQSESGLRSRRDDCEFLNAVSAGLSAPLPGYPKACGSATLTAAARRSLLAGSEVFPFGVTKNPLSVQLSVSVPIFNGLATQRQVEAAVAAAKDAEEDRRAAELHLRTAVTRAHDDLVTQYRVIAIERANRRLAEERLGMTRQRYAAGAANIIELLDAQRSLETAERDQLDALYDFQVHLAELEAACGARLRPAA